MSLEGQILGAIKRWDADDDLPEDKQKEYAEMAANVIEYEIENGYSVETVEKILGEDDGE